MSNRINTTRDEDMWTVTELADTGNVSEVEVLRDIETSTLPAERTDEYDDEWVVADEEARRWLAERGGNPDE